MLSSVDSNRAFAVGSVLSSVDNDFATLLDLVDVAIFRR